MLWNIVKGVLVAVLVKKISERYFKDKTSVVPVQLDLDMPSRPRTVKKPSAVKGDSKASGSSRNAVNDPQNATESTS